MDKDLTYQIKELKKEKNAIILAHFYQPPEIQELADAVGDSYYLSEIARDCKEEVVVFCGVRFMGESAKILSPEKTVLMPVSNAGCPMADMVDEEGVIKLKQQYPNALVVCYINSTAKVKAHCDVSVTSSSAIKIPENIDNKEIIFLPDKNLGGYIAEQFPDKNFIFWDGYCKYHNNIRAEEIIELKDKYKNAEVLVHPECKKEIRDLGDYVGSTSGIIKYATNSKNKDFIIATEEGILHELKKNNPNKNFYIPGGKILCTDMKKTTLENLYSTLKNMENEVIVEDEIMEKALNSLLNMHKLAEG